MPYIILISTTVIVALVLSFIWNVPYIYTLIGFAAWAFIGHLVTVDDDIEGGWSNPDGTLPFPWTALIVKGIILAVLCAMAFFFPVLRTLGVGS